MKSKYKKPSKAFFLTSFIGLSTTSISVLTLASCGSTTPPIVDEATNIVGIKVKSNPILSSNELNETTISLATATKLFDGINNDNFNNLTPSWNVVESTKRKIMVLKANAGFKFEGLQINETLKSNEITIMISGIVAKETPGIINANEVSGPISLSTTQKLFDGINDDNFNNLTPSWKINDVNNKYTLVLVVKNGFVLTGDSKEIESLPFSVSSLPAVKILTREIVLSNLQPGGAWDIVKDGTLTTQHLASYTEIGEGAFKDIQKIRPRHIFEVEIPNTVTKISKEAFANELTALPNDIRFIKFEANSTLEIIDEFAFSKMANLLEIIIPQSVKTIGIRAFQGCNKLNSLSFMAGSKLESIGSLAFQGNKFDLLILPDGLKEIGYNAFAGCNDLTEIYIPLSVTVIGNTPFLNVMWAPLTKISVPSIFKDRTDKLGLIDYWNMITWL